LVADKSLDGHHREIEDAGGVSMLGQSSRSLPGIKPATSLERFREEFLVEVEGWDQPSRRCVLGLGCTRSARIVGPNLDMVANVRVNRWVAQCPKIIRSRSNTVRCSERRLR
jgi:hypothetical protein